MSKTDPEARTSTIGKLALPILFVAILLALIVFEVLPNFREIGNTRASIEQLKVDLQQQKTLLPVFTSLQQRKEKSLPEGISVNKLEPLKIEALGELPDIFESLARESGVELVSAIPQVRSLQDGHELLRVDARVRGEFLAFNSLLTELNDMPFVASFESLTMEVTNLGPEMNVSVWLATQ